MADAGLSTIGVKVGYGLSTISSNTETKPASYTLLTRINAVGGVSLNQEAIDASALEDAIAKYIPGRSDTGGNFPITVNLTSATRAEWAAVISAYAGRTAGTHMYFEIYHPSLDKAFFIKAAPPAAIPMPEMGQNSLMTVEIQLTIEEFVGLDTAVVPTAA